MATRTAKPATARLRRNVEDELACEPSLNAEAIGVATHDGVVTLTGHVATHTEKIAAEAAASRVRGVKAIVSEIEVRLSDRAQPEDEELAQLAVQALASDTRVPAGRIQVCVEHGWLSLAGEVDWQYQRKAAYDAVAHLRGVRGVHDLLTIKPVPVSAAVKAHIEAALERSFGSRGSHIVVESSGDHVTLRGKVQSLAERQAAESAAWTTPGVCHVNNNIAVAPGPSPSARRRVTAAAPGSP